MAAQSAKKVLIVATSADKMGDHATGAWSEEISGPYYTFTTAGLQVDIASPKGGKIPIDAGSLHENFKTENDTRLEKDSVAQAKLNESLVVTEIDPAEYEAIWFAGGHGTCVDFPDLGAVVSKWWKAGKIVGSVCHGQTCLVNATESDGSTKLVEGKTITGFTDEEETQVGLQAAVPFLLESKLKELGSNFESGGAWSSTAKQDGKLITGQNPQSSVAAAQLVVAEINKN